MLAAEHMQQPPARNESKAGADVYSHSGEFSVKMTDIAIPGRGLAFKLSRTYRAGLAHHDGPLGRGWTFNYAKRLIRDGEDIVYANGDGRVFRFRHRTMHTFETPAQLYAVLHREGENFRLRERHGLTFTFGDPDDGGRLLGIEDRNANRLVLRHAGDELEIVDPLGHRIVITHSRGHAVELSDHTHRAWSYEYDPHGCLVAVIQPPAGNSAETSRIRYSYDQAHRLQTITSPAGHTFLRNFYDGEGRVVRQEHGTGFFEFEYEPLEYGPSHHPVYRTHVRQKNGGRVTLEHDPVGHVIKRTAWVSAASVDSGLMPGTGSALIPLITTSTYNASGELISRGFPAGDTMEWRYSDTDSDPLARGNLLEVTHKPAPSADTDQPCLTKRFSYEPHFQLVQTAIDARGYTTSFKRDRRGNVTHKIYPPVTVQLVDTASDGTHPTQMRELAETFAYNGAGQMIRATDPRGAVTEYHYYPADDPCGAHAREGSREREVGGGYLARVVRDPASPERDLPGNAANMAVRLKYDARGNLTELVDGKGNERRLRYDTHSRLIGMKMPAPASYELAIRRDANGNLCEAEVSFEHFIYEPGQGVVSMTSALRESREYDTLDKITARKLVSGSQEQVTRFDRDANENIARIIHPLGDVTEFRYDERDLLTERREAAGSAEEAVVRFTHGRNGRRASVTDARGNTAEYRYDGFGRHTGSINAAGTVEHRNLDPNGNITHAAMMAPAAAAPLHETFHHYDELNRRVQSDLAWHDVAGVALGASRWDGRAGVVSGVTEYADNHQPARTWDESGNIQVFTYDGANQLISSSDAAGHSITASYDENGNRVTLELLGPRTASPEERFQQTITQQFDELDRPVSRSVNMEPPFIVTYNALSAVTSYTNQTGAETRLLHDIFGRRAGQADIAVTPLAQPGEPASQPLIEQIEWDANNRVIAQTNAAGHRTQYQYNLRNKRTAEIYADGNRRQSEYDTNGNRVRVVDADGNVIIQAFDPLGRLTERHVQPHVGGSVPAERFQYDGLGRLTEADAGAITVQRRYDSRSRLLEEVQAGRTMSYSYDSAGNRTRLIHPSGRELRRSFDICNRVADIRDSSGAVITQYSYRMMNQRSQQVLGSLLRADFTYTPCQNLLAEVVYRSMADGSLVEGRRYRYDPVGNWTQEIQLAQGTAYGDRYRYDSAGRLVEAQYGVQDLTNPSSPLQRTVQYSLNETAGWRRKTELDGSGVIISQQDGVTSVRDSYLALGDRRFDYDASGNRTAEWNGPGAECEQEQYAYDYAGRLIGYECHAADGTVARAVEYQYDAFGRPVRKRTTRAATTTETAWVWSGDQLVEEWQNGAPATTFFYGSSVGEPVQMQRHTGADTESLFYTISGECMTTAVVGPEGPVERYSYEIFGQPSLTGSVIFDPKGPAAVPARPPLAASPSGNRLFVSGLVWDDDTGLYLTRSRSYDPSTAQVLHQAFNTTMTGQFSQGPGAKPPITDMSYSKCLGVWGPVGGVVGGIAGGIAAGLLFGPEAAGAGAKVGFPAGVWITAMLCPDDPGPADCPPSQPPGPDGPPPPDLGVPEEPPTQPPPPSPDSPNECTDPGLLQCTPPPDQCANASCPGSDPGPQPPSQSVDPGSGDGLASVDPDPAGGGGIAVGGGGGGCFAGDTLVATEQGLRPIRDIQPGEKVYALDVETGEIQAQHVLRAMESRSEEILTLHFGTEQFCCTPRHRFYTGTWMPAEKLRTGDRVLNSDGQWAELRGISRESRQQPVFNLRVSGIHNYLIGHIGLVVHNEKVAGDPFDVDNGE